MMPNGTTARGPDGCITFLLRHLPRQFKDERLILSLSAFLFCYSCFLGFHVQSIDATAKAARVKVSSVA